MPLPSGVRATTALIGRETESRALSERIDASQDRGGGALVIRGAPGIGKTSLLEVARAHALATGLEVLGTTGVQSETQLPFAGLHHLLKPVLCDIDRLPESYGKALRSAFGLIDEPVISHHQVAMATLQLLGESAERSPLLVLVDDAQWLDSSTVGAVAFVARRLESDPIVLIAALRDGFESPLLEAGIAELMIEALAEEHAEHLLDARSPHLDPELRDRVLRSAAGNPLALVELSSALRSTGDADRLLWASDLQLTARLERAFADRLSSLTTGARTLLRIAAADAKGLLAELLSAASSLEGQAVTLEAVAEAEAARLIEVDGAHLRFLHPLMRSAIHQAMTLDQRQRVHAALAAILDRDPDRRAWHRASAAVGASDEIAAELDAAAARAHARGAEGVALAALERAAQVAANPARRADRLIQAVHLALILGRVGDVARLLNEIQESDLGPLDRPQVAFIREVTQGSWSGTSWIAPHADIADRMRAEGEVDRGLDALGHIGLRCWWSNPDANTRARVVEVVERFPVPEEDSRLIHILALAAPVERGAAVIDRLSRYWSGTTDDLGVAQKLGIAAMATGDFVQAERFINDFIGMCRTLGLLGALSNLLTFQAWINIQRGDWKQADSCASEATQLGTETGQRTWPTVADLAAATLLGYRGEIHTAETLVSESERALLHRGPTPMLALVQYARGAASLADGRHGESFEHLIRIFDPTDIAYHPHIRSWALVDLVEAAVLSGREAEATTFVAELEALGIQTRSPLLEAALSFARPLLSPAASEAAFQAGLSHGMVNWPFIRARLQLAYGIWLRRQRRVADSRTPLRAAREAFDVLGAVPWGERARQELRASGETSRRRKYDLIDPIVAPGAADRPTGLSRSQQQGDRTAAIPLTPNHRHPPLPDLPEARHHDASPPARCVG